MGKLWDPKSQYVDDMCALFQAHSFDYVDMAIISTVMNVSDDFRHFVHVFDTGSPYFITFNLCFSLLASTLKLLN